MVHFSCLDSIRYEVDRHGNITVKTWFFLLGANTQDL